MAHGTGPAHRWHCISTTVARLLSWRRTSVILIIAVMFTSFLITRASRVVSWAVVISPRWLVSSDRAAVISRRWLVVSSRTGVISHRRMRLVISRRTAVIIGWSAATSRLRVGVSILVMTPTTAWWLTTTATTMLRVIATTATTMAATTVMSSPWTTMTSTAWPTSPTARPRARSWPRVRPTHTLTHNEHSVQFPYCDWRVSTTTLGQLQSGLKTTLFRLAYGTWLGTFVTG